MTPEQIILLSEWEEAKRKAVTIAKPLVEKEMELRKKVAESFFPEPVEGTNNAELQAGWKIKYTHALDYKLDDAVMASVRWSLEEAGISPDNIFKYTPSLILKNYRNLGDNIKPIVDAALTIKPKSPTLELIAPK